MRNSASHWSAATFGEGGAGVLAIIVQWLLLMRKQWPTRFPLQVCSVFLLTSVTVFAQAAHSRPLVVRVAPLGLSPALSTMAPTSGSGVAPGATVYDGSNRPVKSHNSSTTLSAAPLLTSAPAALDTIPGLDFDGIPYGGYGSAPPDANGAAGTTQYLEWANARLAVYSKSTGALLAGPVVGNYPWKNFGGPCASTNYGDGVVEYDHLAGRFVISRHAGSGSTWYQCVAVSATSNATGRYYLYAFPLPSNFPDYPKLSVWSDAYYLTINEEQTSNFAPLGALVCALQRSSMLSGAAANAVCFQLPSTQNSLLPADLDGSTAPPAGSPNYLVNLGANSLNLWQFHVDFNTPSNSTLTGPVNIAVAPFTRACGGGVCVPQLGTSQLLDSLADRVMSRLSYRNFGTYESLLITHSVGAPSMIRWYELRSPGTTPTIFQQGTFSPDSNYRWMGSIAQDQMGDIAVGYSVSSSSMYPSIAYTGRLVSDPVGTMESENTIITGLGAQTLVNRWGDYTSMTIDPTDDCTFWYANEYYQAGATTWTTHIGSFKFPSCP